LSGVNAKLERVAKLMRALDHAWGMNLDQTLDGADAAFSPLGMFLAADIVVQAVMLGLIIASVAVWTVLIAKSLSIGAAARALRGSLVRLKEPVTLAAAADLPSPIARALVNEAADEVAASDGLGHSQAVRERIAVGLERIVASEARRMGAGVTMIATIGSTSPFVGLFGTVWGIMNSFIGIAKTHTTNLAVVAPGIAEALLATACGLIVAIPAVIIYNHLSRALSAYRALVGDGAALVTRLASRELDRRAGATL